MKDIKQYTEKTLEKVLELEEEKNEKITDLKSMVGKKQYVLQGQIRVESTITEEDVQKQIEEVNTEYSKKVEPVLEELMQMISDSEKEAKQEYYGAEPVATAEQRMIATDIVKDYKEDKNNGLNKDKLFMEALEDHVENQTVKALPYILSYKDLVPEADIEPYLIRIAPDMVAAKEYMQDVESANALFRMYQLRQEAKKPGLTNIDRISIKRQFYELGGNPNTLDI